VIMEAKSGGSDISDKKMSQLSLAIGGIKGYNPETKMYRLDDDTQGTLEQIMGKIR
jgi:hypothetical protein